MPERRTGYTEAEAERMDRAIGAYEWVASRDGRLHAVVEWSEDARGHRVVRSTLCRRLTEFAAITYPGVERCGGCLGAMESKVLA